MICSRRAKTFNINSDSAGVNTFRSTRFRVPGREERNSRIAIDYSLTQRKIKDRSQSKPKMIDHALSARSSGSCPKPLHVVPSYLRHEFATQTLIEMAAHPLNLCVCSR
jgi:hypothetical protein